MSKHICDNISCFSIDSLHQLGTGRGSEILIIGESPSPNGWIISGKACYKSNGKILPTGKRLNEYLAPLKVSVEVSGFTELSKCLVSNRNQLYDCSKKCWPILLEQIKKQDYKIFILLGVKTTDIFCKLSNKQLSMGIINNLIIENVNYNVLPIFHPSPINPTGHIKNLKIFKQLHKDIESILTNSV